MISFDTLFKLLRIERAIEEGRISVKQWYKSKTIWANLGAIATAVVAGITGEVTWAADVPIITTAVVNLVLRFVTTSGIGTSTASDGQAKPQ